MNERHVDWVLAAAFAALGVAFFLARYNWAILAVFLLVAVVFAWRAMASGYRLRNRRGAGEGGKGK